MRVVFAGTPEFAVPTLDALLSAGEDVAGVYTQPDRPAGRGRRSRPSPVKRRAQAAGLPVFQPESLGNESERARLTDLAPDVVVVVAYGLLLPPAILEVPRLGCINVHASLLPRWRGAAPVHRAILAGDRETGVSIMQMTEGLDTGPVLHRRAIPIRETDTAGELHDRLAELGARALVDTLPRLAAGTATPEAQDDARASHAAKLSKAEARIDWSSPADEIARRVRAFNPWPVCQSEWNGETVRIWEAEALPDPSPDPAGTVVDAGPGGIDVAAKDGTVRIRRLQLPGKRPVSAADFLNARNPVGMRLF